MLDVCLLGVGGTEPLPNRWLSSFIINYKGKMLLIDCGEGTQIALKALGWGLKHIDTLCLTHYHGDHVSGLPGLLLTMGKSERERPLKIMGPEGLEKIVAGLTVIAPHLPYELTLTEIPSDDSSSYEMEGFTLKTLPLEHTVPCIGYSIYIKRGKKFDKQKAMNSNIPIHFWNRLQKGEVIASEGITYTPGMVLGEERKGLKICYCTDTRPVHGLKEFIHQADLFVCEGMYAEEEKIVNAEKHKHMLFSEAAKLATEGEVEELWLTHFSPSLVYPHNYQNQVTQLFANTKIGESGMVKKLKFDKD